MATGFPVALKDDPNDTAAVPNFGKHEFNDLFFAAYDTRTIPVFWQNLARKKKMNAPMDAIYTLFCEIAQEVQSEFRQNKKQDYRLAKLRPGHMALMVALTEGCDEKDLTKQKIKRRLKNAMRLTLRSSVPAAEADESIDNVVVTTMATRMDELLDEKRRVERSEAKKRRIDGFGETSSIGASPSGEPVKSRREGMEDLAAEAHLQRQMLLLARETDGFPPGKIKELNDRATDLLDGYFRSLHGHGHGSLAHPKYAPDPMDHAGVHDIQAMHHGSYRSAGVPVSLGHVSAAELSVSMPMGYPGLNMSSSPAFRGFPGLSELSHATRGSKSNSGKQ